MRPAPPGRPPPGRGTPPGRNTPGPPRRRGWRGRGRGRTGGGGGGGGGGGEGRGGGGGGRGEGGGRGGRHARWLRLKGKCGGPRPRRFRHGAGRRGTIIVRPGGAAVAGRWRSWNGNWDGLRGR